MKTEWLTPREFLVRNQGRIGRNTLYEWLANGTLPKVQVGRKILIPADAFERMLASGDRTAASDG